MSELARHRADWDALGRLDPLYAILSGEERKHGRWDETEFFASGERDVGRLMAIAGRLGLPARRGEAFELGCGVGRLTRALADRFDRCVGVDISAEMIARARTLNADRPGCEWAVTRSADLRDFDSGRFDLVLSHLVLQHQPDKATIARYLAEMARILAPGGLMAVQVPASMPLRQRLQPRRRLYGALRRAHVPDRVLYDRLGLDPIRMNWLPRGRAVQALTGAGARIVDIELGWLGDRAATGREVNLTFLATR